MIKLSQVEYNTLKAIGTLTKDGVTYTYSPTDTIYVTPTSTAMPTAVSSLFSFTYLLPYGGYPPILDRFSTGRLPIKMKEPFYHESGKKFSSFNYATETVTATADANYSCYGYKFNVNNLSIFGDELLLMLYSPSGQEADNSKISIVYKDFNDTVQTNEINHLLLNSYDYSYLHIGLENTTSRALNAHIINLLEGTYGDPQVMEGVKERINLSNGDIDGSEYVYIFISSAYSSNDFDGIYHCMMSLPNGIQQVVDMALQDARPKKVTITDNTTYTMADNTEYYGTGLHEPVFNAPTSGDYNCYFLLTFADSGTIGAAGDIFPDILGIIGEVPEFLNGETWEVIIKNGNIKSAKVEPNV